MVTVAGGAMVSPHQAMQFTFDSVNFNRIGEDDSYGSGDRPDHRGQKRKRYTPNAWWVNTIAKMSAH
jgi:hypothetical protein